MTLTRLPTVEVGPMVTNSTINPWRRYLSKHRKPVKLVEKILDKKAAINRGFFNALAAKQRLTRRPSPPPRHTSQLMDDLQAQRKPLVPYHRHGSHI